MRKYLFLLFILLTATVSAMDASFYPIWCIHPSTWEDIQISTNSSLMNFQINDEYFSVQFIEYDFSFVLNEENCQEVFNWTESFSLGLSDFEISEIDRLLQADEEHGDEWNFSPIYRNEWEDIKENWSFYPAECMAVFTMFDFSSDFTNLNEVRYFNEDSQIIIGVQYSVGVFTHNQSQCEQLYDWTLSLEGVLEFREILQFFNLLKYGYYPVWMP